VAVIEGTNAAERALNDFNSCQSEEGRRAGWMYFLEKTDLKPGMDAARATRLREVHFDSQELIGRQVSLIPRYVGKKIIS
jgi:hypothetical protein